MNRYIKSVVASLLLIVFVFSGFVPTYAVDEPSKYSTQYNSGTRDVVCTTLNGTSAVSYYSGSYSYDVLSEKSSTEIMNTLRTLMRTTHTYLSSYNDCHYKADRTDCQNEDGSVSLIYTSYSATMNQWNGWNREHVWPQSLGGGNTSGGGADLHHIRPSDAVVNSTRGNKKYGNADGGKATYGSNPASGYLGGYSGTYYEPLDNVKGDVARICLYVYVRWGSDWGATSITSVFQSVDVLLEWCALDPVDTWEMGRNEVVQSIQGNRNVFIDYPEYAWLIFGREVPANMTTPSGEAAEGGSSVCDCWIDSDGDTICDVCGSGGLVTPDPVCNHTNTELRGYVAADCYNSGYTGDVYCLDCDERVSYGNQIPTNNAHAFSEWTLSDDGINFVKTCSVCGAEAVLTIETLIANIDNEAEKILILLTLGVSDCLILDSLTK